MDKTGLTLGSLFSGSGGFELAGLLAGIRPVWNSEIAPFPILVTRKRLPFVKHYGDVSTLDGAELPPVDIVTWGSPCQDISIAGKRAGLGGARSGLYVQAVRIVREMLEATHGEYPKFCVFENVTGLLSSNHGEDFKTCLDMMQELGFIPDANILDSQFMGVPQRRKRVYITWLNADYILSRKTDLSRSITLQLHTEILQTILAELSKASGEGPKKSAATDASLSEDGLNRRIRLFSLQEESRLRKLQDCLDEIQATYGTGPKNSDGSHGEDLMEGSMSTAGDTRFTTSNAGSRSGSIAWSLRRELDDALDLQKSSTISTLTKETTNRKICFYLRVVQNTLDATIRLMQSRGSTAATVGQCYEWVTHTLTWMEGYIDARRRNDEDFKAMVRDDLLRFCEQEISACEDILERYSDSGCGREVLPFGEGLSGYSAEGFRAWQRAAGGAASGSGAAGGICLNNEGCVPGAVGTAAGFCTEHSAKARSIGYGEEISPTLRAGTVPAAVYENHSQSTRYTGPLATAPTVSATYGTGGNNQPFVVKEAEAYDVRITSEGTKNARANVYGTDTARTIDTGIPAPDRNQGGVAIVERHPVVGGAHDPYREEDVSPTVDTNGARPTCCQVGVSVVEAYSTSKNSHHTKAEKELANTLVATDYKDPPTVSYGINDEGEVRTPAAEKGKKAVAEQSGYAVRRLTPTECARLQGFPDWWCSNLATENPTEEDIAFWRDVFETYRIATGSSSRPKTDRQIVKWLKNPYSDSAEYAMYGNGIALPCAWFVLSGIVYYAHLNAH